FGSITNKDIAQYLAENYQIEIDRKKIEFNETMKKIGDYPVTIRLHKEVATRLNVIIAPEEETKRDDKVSGEEIKG
ncbi:MAG TPA: 50S ribosomal L9 C-terminal domain-containing protein, partial [Atribacterota bacterium]|nr:50S ribosomal L9 C-terminal domain-containing protein [Atribacterota bacterium]